MGQRQRQGWGGCGALSVVKIMPSTLSPRAHGEARQAPVEDAHQLKNSEGNDMPTLWPA